MGDNLCISPNEPLFLHSCQKSESIFAMSHVLPSDYNVSLVTHLTVDQIIMCKMHEDDTLKPDLGRVWQTGSLVKEANWLGEFQVS